MNRNLAVVAAGFFLAAAAQVAKAQTQLDAAGLQRATSATVLIKAERVYRGSRFPSSGSGFFVSADGHVMTNWHVVADQVQIRLLGKVREVSAHVQSLEVVIDSGKPNERVLPAAVVARDRKRDLALLHVRYSPQEFLPVATASPVKLAQKVWIVGFPFGELLSESPADKGDGRNPELTVNSGIITSLRHGDDGRLKAIQTDAAVNPGNSGGPMVDGAGRVVGVVNARVAGGEGLGFGIPPSELRAFVRAKAFKVTFQPSVVFDPPDTISVTVEPILAHLSGTSGTIRFEGTDIRPVEVPLELQGATWVGTINPPTKIAGRKVPESYTAEIRFEGAAGRRIVARRYRLRTLSLSDQPKLASGRDPGQMMEDRRLLGNSTTLSDYTKDQGAAGEKNRRLSDVAAGIKLKRSPSGSVVVDDHLLNKVSSPLDRVFPDSRYNQIGDPTLRRSAKEYDAARWICDEIDRQMPLIHEYEQNPDYRVRSRAYALQRQYDQYRAQFGEALISLTAQLKAVKLVYCSEQEKWYFEHAAPCEMPEYPHD